MISVIKQLKLISLYIGIIILKYFLPSWTSTFVLLSLLALIFKSKEDSFWLVFVFLLVDPPGGLFPNFDLNYGLQLVQRPIFIGFQEFFIYILFIKALTKTSKYKILYYRPLYLLALLYFVLLIYSFLLEKNPGLILKSIKWTLPWTMVYSIAVLMDTREKWDNFFRLLFPMVFVIEGLQIYHLILGYPPANLLGTNFAPTSGELSQFFVEKSNLDYDENVARPLFSQFYLFICLFGSLFYLTTKQKVFKASYLYSVVLTVLAFMFISATRGYVLSSVIIFLIYILFIKRDITLPIKITAIGVPIVLVLLQFDIVHQQILGAGERILTMKALAQGDITAGGTLDRLSEYTPHLLEKFSESPILGWAFTSTFFNNNNGHVGFANLLMNVGIIGNLFFLYFWLHLLVIPLQVNNKLSMQNPYKSGPKVLVAFFLCLMVIHLSSGQQFGYHLGFTGVAFSQVIFYGFSDFMIRAAKNEELKLQSQKSEAMVKSQITS